MRNTAESEKLARHLTEAYDEAGQPARQGRSRHGIRPGDTGYGFERKLPLSDL